MNITPESPMVFNTIINGVACRVLVTHYLPMEPSITSGPMENAQEAVPAEFEFTATALRSGAQIIPDQETEDRIFAEFEAFLLALKYDKDF